MKFSFNVHVRNLLLAATAAVLVTSCASSSEGTKPDDMSAAEHRKMAKSHQKQVENHESMDSAQWRYGPEDVNGQGGYYINTESHFSEAGTHQATADAHLAAAKALEKYEEHECGYFPPATRSVCPLVGQVASVQMIDGGAQATFNDGVNVEAAVAHIQCHLAYAGTQGHAGMDSCPLYLKGVKAAANGETSVDFTIEDPAQISVLRNLLKEHVSVKPDTAPVGAAESK